MKIFSLYKSNKSQQYLLCLLLIGIVSVACYFLSAYVGYKVVALILLVTVSLVAMFFNIWIVLMAAILSALIWDFFFIPPRFTFTVRDTEDALMLLMYFIIALVNAVLTLKIRQIEKETQKKEEKEKTVVLYNTILNSLSHELKTPISTIIAATDNLLTDNEKLSDQSKNELVKEISKASIRLDRQVENLLNMSRLESGFIKLNKDWCDLNELIHDVVNRLKENLEDRAIIIQIQENIPLFKLDFGFIEQVLHNLIHNAALYIPKYCVITIKAMCRDEKLVLIVEDNGYGFPEDEIGRVFDKFYRLRNSSTGGTGLGLSIVKGFVEAHNGKIKLENIPDGGAKFTIEIPTETSYINYLKNE
jgi:two-component system, OmpR family, sensor histidine kinase KdpD